jgi:hypothetical protein
MTRRLKRLFLLVVIVCIPLGFLTKHEHAVFPWHTIPSMDAIFGALGALLLIAAIKIVGSFASREEDFYD